MRELGGRPVIVVGPVLMSVVMSVAVERFPGWNPPRKMSARELGDITMWVAQTGSEVPCGCLGRGHGTGLKRLPTSMCETSVPAGGASATP